MVIDPLKKPTKNEKGRFDKSPINQVQILKDKKKVIDFKTNISRADPWKNIKKQTNDFASHYLPTDDIYASSGSGTDSHGGLAQYQWIAERRVGLGPKLTRKPAVDAVQNRFKIFNTETDEEDKFPELFEWIKDTDFYNQLAEALYFERVYGMGLLMKYYSENDKERQDFDSKAPKGKAPVALQALPPTYLAPTDTYRTSYLDTDPQKWDFQGGMYNSQKIHHSRIEVIMTRRVPDRWRGLSVFEPIWIPLMSYFQAQIYLLRAFTRLGNVIPAYMVDTEDDLEDVYTKYANLFDEMKMNGMFIGRKGDDINMNNTQIGTGLEPLMEMWKEDISAGTSIPVPIIWGRVTAAGMSGAAYLMAERYYWTEISNIQTSITDDCIRIFEDAGFDFTNRRIEWNLAVTKTDQQRLLDEGMEIQNEMMKEQLIQSQLNTQMMAEQFQAGLHLEQPMDQPQQSQSKPQKEQKDFLFDVFAERKRFIDKLMEERNA